MVAISTVFHSFTVFVQLRTYVAQALLLLVMHDQFVTDVIIDCLRNPVELITSKGLPGESHIATTRDGYQLGMHRIARPGATPVLLQHGLLDSSATWVANLRSQSLGFLLYDAGYDVWLGNVRGNTYSKRHLTLDVNSDQFWDFSIDEMAKYDLPAMINHVLNTTGKPHLYYAGHSQGSMIAFAQLSSDQELASKVKMFFGLGPVTTLRYVSSPVGQLVGKLEGLMPNVFGKREFLPKNQVVEGLARSVCRSAVRDICSNILFVITGQSDAGMNKTRLPVYLANTPAGTSVKNMMHFSQLIQSGQFEAFNYKDLGKNLARYGQLSPPVYKPQNIITPTVLYYGSEDTLADPRDIQYLLPKLRNLRGHMLLKGWNHMDFIWGLDAASTVYADIISRINQEESAGP